MRVSSRSAVVGGPQAAGALAADAQAADALAADALAADAQATDALAAGPAVVPECAVGLLPFPRRCTEWNGVSW